jgi:hypothetical protein
VHSRFRITHPFHPLRGREFDAVDSRSGWGKHWLYCYDEDGRLFAVPSQWTDAAETDPFATVAAGRACCRVDDLVLLLDLVGAIAMKAGET